MHLRKKYINYIQRKFKARFFTIVLCFTISLYFLEHMPNLCSIQTLYVTDIEGIAANIFRLLTGKIFK